MKKLILIIAAFTIVSTSFSQKKQCKNEKTNKHSKSKIMRNYNSWKIFELIILSTIRIDV